MGFGSINRGSACEPGQVGKCVEKQEMGECLRAKFLCQGCLGLNPGSGFVTLDGLRNYSVL